MAMKGESAIPYTGCNDLGIPQENGNCYDTNVEPSGIRQRCMALSAQVFPPFLVAGMGMVAAGLLLGYVTKHWDVFLKIDSILVLVPALLGLKGNLEMTLASRLSTHANLGNLDHRFSDVFRGGQFASIICGNIIVVQCQAIVVGLLASGVANTVHFVSHGRFNSSHALLLATSAVAAASAASFLLSVIMVVVVILARRCRLNPDNVASPIAGMLGDFCTLGLLATIAEALWSSRQHWAMLQHVLLCSYIIVGPICAFAASRNEHARPVLAQGWTPVVVSMFISSAGGVILKHAHKAFLHLASFAPVMNGAGGNLAAVHTSRLSTDLHHSKHSGLDEELAPVKVVRADSGSVLESGSVLAFLAVPGAICFSSLIVGVLSGWSASPSVLFSFLFLTATMVQVVFLMVVSTRLVPWLWRHGVDPDNAAIPYVTSLGDIVGTLLLTCAFWCLQQLGGHVWNVDN
eukprot:TRINITY_DN45410_c0_g1_i1.p1 TRINITY_DN45410_c0_g1~~TRINITY_DN45410_c0_g1_i1.p1  ORF type:complete len:461 (-),score=71.04 TRINITY_DN45410_c0_g1_i1:346-1728(-)